MLSFLLFGPKQNVPAGVQGRGADVKSLMQKPGGRMRPSAEISGSPAAVVIMPASSPFGSLFYLYAKPLVLVLQALTLVAIKILECTIEITNYLVRKCIST